MARTGRSKAELILSDEERGALEEWVRDRSTPRAWALRCRIVLACAGGASNKDVAAEVGSSPHAVGRWRARFVERRIAGLGDMPRSGGPRTVTDEQVATVVRRTLETAPENAAHWSTRAMAKETGLSQSTVSRIWRTYGLRAHRTETCEPSARKKTADEILERLAGPSGGTATGHVVEPVPPGPEGAVPVQEGVAVPVQEGVAVPVQEGVRERKKQRTRRVLIDVAHELFEKHGYEQTPVDRIAKAARVSQRTFFRYFAGKEDVALATVDEVLAVFAQAVAARPRSEAPMEVLRLALRDTVERVRAQDPRREAQFGERFRRLNEAPGLLAAHLRREEERNHVLVAEVAEREGVDPVTDPRPHLLVAAFAAAMRVSIRHWYLEEATSDLAGLPDEVDRHIELLGPALAGHWSRPLS
ncbi:TetR family transcriptional regulator [Streptomyces iconiensis]|uniref:TetR family transcriptional regulator n=1 Tax=Streptomyces iconiensis TaxID=1384038 RepID=A0ABT6ZV89_9ACTN|nr:TetR family transcriptional regulator [Streptomyces iconiensis]MDJ1132729.1 TetR family transcriptional regulator [Streptomyces iconiensis]